MSASVRGDVERKELKAQWKAEVEVPEYTIKDVAQHKAKDDTWIVIHGKVYNITDYIQDHPGGAEALMEVAGEDATTAYEDVGHSEDAREIMNPYLVGVVKDAAKFTPAQTVKVVRRGNSTEIKKSSSSSSLQVAGYSALGMGTAGIAYAVSRSGKLSVPVPNIRGLDKILGKEHRFVQGVVLATAVCSALGFAVAHRIQAAASIQAGFSKYPPYKKAAIAAPSHFTTGFLAPKEYKKLTLVKKEYLSDTAVRFVFSLPTTNTVLGLPIGQHVAIKGIIDGQEVVTRSYTPTSNNTDIGRLELLIRIYDDGLLTGKYLKNLEVGDEVEFRGPKGAMRYRKGWTKEIGMIAGGTGITPMYQLIRAICEDDTDTTQVSLIYASRSEDDILLRKELDAFARRYPKNFRAWYTLDRPTDAWKFGRGFVTKDLMEEKLPGPSPDSKVLLCGPPGMINASKKSLIELGWQAPGAVSKMGDQIFCF